MYLAETHETDLELGRLLLWLALYFRLSEVSVDQSLEVHLDLVEDGVQLECKTPDVRNVTRCEDVTTCEECYMRPTLVARLVEAAGLIMTSMW